MIELNFSKILERKGSQYHIQISREGYFQRHLPLPLIHKHVCMSSLIEHKACVVQQYFNIHTNVHNSMCSRNKRSEPAYFPGIPNHPPFSHFLLLLDQKKEIAEGKCSRDRCAIAGKKELHLSKTDIRWCGIWYVQHSMYYVQLYQSSYDNCNLI